MQAPALSCTVCSCRQVYRPALCCTQDSQRSSTCNLCAGFSFPLFLTTAHMVFSFVALLPIMMAAPFRKLHRGVLTKQWKGLACVGACAPAFRASAPSACAPTAL